MSKSYKAVKTADHTAKKQKKADYRRKAEKALKNRLKTGFLD